MQCSTSRAWLIESIQEGIAQLLEKYLFIAEKIHVGSQVGKGVIFKYLTHSKVAGKENIRPIMHSHNHYYLAGVTGRSAIWH
jgi:hypothetical protein